MTDERDPKVSQRYRELGREEPPGELDAGILAASRRAAETRLAPLVPPTGRRRWYFPVAAAAIITLAVAVTVHMERSQPDAEDIAPPPPAAPPVPAAPELRKEAPPARLEPSPSKPEAAGQPSGPRRFTPEPPQPAAPPAAPAPLPRPADAMQERRSADVQPESRVRANESSQPQAVPREAPSGASARLLGQVAKAQSPEAALERIAELRRQGKHDEADKALAEFRRRYADYRIAEEMLKKVERR
jgi:hypothetical protein